MLAPGLRLSHMKIPGEGDSASSYIKEQYNKDVKELMRDRFECDESGYLCHQYRLIAHNQEIRWQDAAKYTYDRYRCNGLLYEEVVKAVAAVAVVLFAHYAALQLMKLSIWMYQFLANRYVDYQAGRLVVNTFNRYSGRLISTRPYNFFDYFSDAVGIALLVTTVWGFFTYAIYEAYRYFSASNTLIHDFLAIRKGIGCKLEHLSLEKAESYPSKSIDPESLKNEKSGDGGVIDPLSNEAISAEDLTKPSTFIHSGYACRADSFITALLDESLFTKLGDEAVEADQIESFFCMTQGSFNRIFSDRFMYLGEARERADLPLLRLNSFLHQTGLENKMVRRIFGKAGLSMERLREIDNRDRRRDEATIRYFGHYNSRVSRLLFLLSAS